MNMLLLMVIFIIVFILLVVMFRKIFIKCLKVISYIMYLVMINKDLSLKIDDNNSDEFSLFVISFNYMIGVFKDNIV